MHLINDSDVQKRGSMTTAYVIVLVSTAESTDAEENEQLKKENEQLKRKFELYNIWQNYEGLRRRGEEG
jgi:hypothetical protein